MPRMLPALIVLLGLAFAALGCGGDDDGTSTAAVAGAATAPATATATTPDRPQPPSELLDPRKRYVVTLETNMGDIPIRLDQKTQPRTAASFAQLARDGFFDGLTFHRIVPGFVIQGGDPAGDGTGGPGYSITEKPPKDAVYSRGVVAMAKGELERPGTSGSQFFIVTTLDAGLPPDYALVGKVTHKALEAVNRIENVPTDARDAPQEPVIIEKATVKETDR